MDKLGKIPLHHWKKHLKISKLVKFESDNYVLRERRYNAAKLRKFTDVCILGGNFAPPPPPHNIQTSVNYRNFGELNLRQLSKNHFQTLKILAELWRAKRACGAPWVSKSTQPRKFGNHVTVHRPQPARPSAPQGNQCSITLSSLGAQED